MKKNNILIFIIFILLFHCFATVHADTLKGQAISSEIKLPKPPAYRVGTTDDIEARYKVLNIKKEKEVNSITINKNEKNLSFAETDIKKLAREITQDLQADNDKIFQDISILWGGAVQKSETIKFAIYKLSNPDADKPNNGIVKKIISPIANISTLAGAGVPDPIVSTSAFLCGNLLSIFSKDEKELNYKFTKVNDADMVILVRKIDDLQKNIINYYCDYIREKKTLELKAQILEKRKTQYQQMLQANDNELLITDAYYRAAADSYVKTQMKFLSTRALLEQLVGNEAMTEFEANLENDKEEKLNG